MKVQTSIFDIVYFQRLEEHVSKHSPTLGRDAQYSKKVSINKYSNELLNCHLVNVTWFIAGTF